MRNFRELTIWKDGMDLAELCYSTMKQMPSEESFGLTRQIKRCIVSIPSNIAEGCSRSSNKEFRHYLELSMGSAFEAETQILLARRFGMITEVAERQLVNNLQVLQRKINSFITKIKNF